MYCTRWPGYAQEWTWNETDDGFPLLSLLSEALGVVLPTSSTTAGCQAAFFASAAPANGFRCAPLLRAAATVVARAGPAHVPRTYSLEKPRGRRRPSGLSAAPTPYAPRELAKATVDEVDDSSPYWRKEKVSFSAAYGDERVPAFALRPSRQISRPIRHRSHTPGAGAVLSSTFAQHAYGFNRMEFIIRSGGGSDLSDLYRYFQPPAAHDVEIPAEGAICQEVESRTSGKRSSTW